MEPEKSPERVHSTSRDIDRLKKKYVSQMQSERSAMKSPAREEDKQLHSMRLRLSGMQKTIHNLEERNRSKTEKIMVLEKELAEQQRRSENLSQKINETSLRSPIPIQPQNTPSRIRDKDLEKKCQDLEQSLAKERKHSLRLAEINSQLLAKLKAIEISNPFQSQLEEMQRENERLQKLCMKLQHSNDTLENEAKASAFQLREIKTKTAGYMAAAEEMFRSHERLNSLINSSSSFQF
eukprot:TRINITY_DN42512_c0_g1_i1.p1 TRINITY_DN42512_c0_g1~~TRINITY_DN42512_c0_g1_i1.p1  ORF type:complete len:237 (-),score=44.72 TRINITY_DN42512_c0_g1_i1:74-784(-)